MNALSSSLFGELNDALHEFDHDGSTGAIVITGSEKAFAGSRCSLIALSVIIADSMSCSWGRH